MKGFKTITYSNMAFIWTILLPLFAVLGQSESRSFVIDYENDCFLKDGEPFRPSRLLRSHADHAPDRVADGLDLL